MKAKLKNANGFVRFLLNHGEKIGIAAVLAVAGLLVWSSFGREKLGDDKQPPKLQAAAEAADATVQNMNWEAFPSEEKTDADSVAARSGDGVITPVDPSTFPRIGSVDPPLLDPVKLRSDPELLTALDLEVNPGSGLWLSADPKVIEQKMRDALKERERIEREAREEAERLAEEAEGGRRGRRGRDGEGGEIRGGGFGEMGNFGGMRTKDGAIVVAPQGGAQMQGFEDIRNRSWVTVLAKVPIKQQFDMYEEALATARNFNAADDAPRYVGYMVQRAEVTNEGTGKWVDLPPVRGDGVIKVMSTWPIQTPELVNPKYVHPLLTFPLPPMVMRSWGDEVTHSDLPIPTPEDLMEEFAAAEEQTPAEDEQPDPDSPFGEVLKAAQPGAMGMGRMGMMGGREMGMGMPMGMGGREMGMGMGRSMGMGMGMGREGGMGMGMGMGMMGAGGMTELPQRDWDGVTKFWLFRYFDSTVEPGRRYRYRVRLALFDVNALQPEGFLDKEAGDRLSAEKASRKGKALGWRLTDWSEESPVAVVPQPGLIYIAQTKPATANNVNSEPEARLVVKSLDARYGAEIALHEWFTRGSVLNMRQQAQVIWSSLFKPDPEQPTDSPAFDFLSGLTLVDFEGGEPLVPNKNRDLLAPARALVMDSAGRMRMQNELEDASEVREFDAIIEAGKQAALRERERADERRGGNRGGFGRN